MQGFFNVILGPKDTAARDISTAFTGGAARYLGIKVNGGAELAPRQQILSAPYAIQAQTALYATHGVPPGTIVPFGGETVPEGWLPCEGDSYSRAAYPALFAAIGTAWGASSATDFRVPRLCGFFLRGWNHASGHDPDAASRTATYPGAATGDHVGSEQSYGVEQHTHVPSTVAGYNDDSSAKGGLSRSGTGYSDSSNAGYYGGKETRPKNLAVLYIIKY